MAAVHDLPRQVPTLPRYLRYLGIYLPTYLYLHQALHCTALHSACHCSAIQWRRGTGALGEVLWRLPILLSTAVPSNTSVPAAVQSMSRSDLLTTGCSPASGIAGRRPQQANNWLCEPPRASEPVQWLHACPTPVSFCCVPCLGPDTTSCVGGESGRHADGRYL